MTFLVASSNPLDQYLIQNPGYFFERPPEQARIHPDNLIILSIMSNVRPMSCRLKRTRSSAESRSSDMLEFLDGGEGAASGK